MQWQAIFTLIVVGLLFVSLMFEKIPADISIVIAMLVLWGANVITTKDALAGYSNAGLITVAALFIVIGGVSKLPIMQQLAGRAFGRSQKGRLALLKQTVIVAGLSAFLNNTPLVAFFTPIIKDWARANGLAPSKFLLPLSYSALAGGLLTMIGTSTNLVIQGFLLQKKLPPLGFFDIALVGLPAFALSSLYMCTIGYALLPNRTGLFREVAGHAQDFLSELIVNKNSPLIGGPVHERLASLSGGTAKPIKLLRPKKPTEGREIVVEDTSAMVDSIAVKIGQVSPHGTAVAQGDSVRSRLPTSRTGPDATSPKGVNSQPPQDEEQARESFKVDGIEKLDSGDSAVSTESVHDGLVPEVAGLNETTVEQARIDEDEAFLSIFPIGDTELFQEGDRLVIASDKDMLLHVQSRNDGTRLIHLDDTNLMSLMSQCFEVVIAASNKLVGKVPTDKIAQEHYKFIPLAVRRNGVTMGAADINSIRDIRIAPGDTLLVLAQDSFESEWGHTGEFFVVSRIGTRLQQPSRWQYGSILILIAMFVLGGVGVLEMEKAAMLAAGLTVLCRFVKPEEVYTLIQWNLIVLIGASFALGRAMEVSGLAQDITTGIVSLDISPYGMLYILYGIVVLMTELVSNNAAAALAFPLAVNFAQQLGVSHVPFVIVVLFASTAGFAIPIGYQTHLMVMGPGGYTMRDFLKVGIIMDIIYMVVVASLAPWIWPF